MSSDILKSINKIKISINENDQVLWECQASAKCYTQATTKLREECERINMDIVKIDEEIRELEPHLDILSSCYKIQVESLPLNQESLVNQRLYKKCVIENIKKHQKEVENTVDEYSLHFQKCKEKFELTNPAYRTLQMKRVELKQCKVRCRAIKQKITELKNMNKNRMDIKQRLFYGDIIEFAKSWLTHDKYIRAIKCLNEEKRRERELMQKLMEATELLKQKQKNGCYQKESYFKIPRIEFPKPDIHGNVKDFPQKANRPDCFSDIKTLLDKKDFNMTDPLKQDGIQYEEPNNFQKFEFNASSSKVRVLENRTLRTPQEIEKLLPSQSKEERSKMIAAKLQKVVQNFNKSISRQNSQRHSASQKSISNNFETKCSQKSHASQENNATEMKVGQDSQNVQCKGTGASQQFQNLNITNLAINNPETHFLNQEGNKNFMQSSKNQYQGRLASHLIQKTESTNKEEPNFIITPQDNFGHKKYAQESKFVSKGSFPTPSSHMKPFGEKSKFTMPTSGFGGVFNMNEKSMIEEKIARNILFKKPETTGLNEKSQFTEESKTTIKNTPQSDDTSLKKPIFLEKSQFMTGDSGKEFNTNLNNRSNGHREPSKLTENSTADNDNYMTRGEVSSYHFGNETQFSQMLNASYDDGSYISPQFDHSYVNLQEDNNINALTNFGGSSSFADQPLFSFNQVNPFSFK